MEDVKDFRQEFQARTGLTFVGLVTSKSSLRKGKLYCFSDEDCPLFFEAAWKYNGKEDGYYLFEDENGYIQDVDEETFQSGLDAGLIAECKR